MLCSLVSKGYLEYWLYVLDLDPTNFLCTIRLVCLKRSTATAREQRHGCLSRLIQSTPVESHQLLADDTKGP
jgi:hypothetical protein